MEKPTYYVEKLGQLVGGKIVKIIETPWNERSTYEDYFFGFEIELPSGKRKLVWFLMDDEGNGPGSFDLVDLEKIQKVTWSDGTEMG